MPNRNLRFYPAKVPSDGVRMGLSRDESCLHRRSICRDALRGELLAEFGEELTVREHQQAEQQQQRRQPADQY